MSERVLNKISFGLDPEDVYVITDSAAHAHMEDSSVHATEEDKATWSGKQDKIDILKLTIPAPPGDGDSLHVVIHRKNGEEWSAVLDSETDYAEVRYFDGLDFTSCTSAGIPGMFQGNACCVSVGSSLHKGDLCRYKWKVAGDSTGTQDGDWQGFVWPAVAACGDGGASVTYNGSVVSSMAAGANVSMSITGSGQLTISATGGGGGGVTAAQARKMAMIFG